MTAGVTGRTSHGEVVRTAARPLAQTIAAQGIDLLLDALPDIKPKMTAQQLPWRQGQFHRALAALPVEFPPCPPMRLA